MSVTSVGLDAGKIPLKSSGADSSRVGAEFVILDAEGRVLRGLNPSGARLWELIDGHRSLTELASCIAAEFRVTPERALEDVASFVAQLAQRRLLLLDPSPSSGGAQ